MRAASVAAPASVAHPTLHLSGPKLRTALERLLAGTEAAGGIERWVGGLKLKAAVFERSLHNSQLGALDEHTFLGVCALMPTVRRRIAAWLSRTGFDAARRLLRELLDEARDAASTDDRIATFCAGFPADREHRYARDLAAELLHWSALERHPLMTRWVWDQAADSGVLREIWHDAADPALNRIADGRDTFLVLRAELAQYLTDNGFFRDVPLYVDLLCAQVYASYIAEQGGSYLRADFSSEHDPMQYVRRMLGLDGIDIDSGLTRLKLADGRAYVLHPAAHQT
ncbi:MAG: hypothetical protein IT531_14340 [Burkholderiales bacterium]|nr:hypothetical protein [Burkholderiales bacterium]